MDGITASLKELIALKQWACDKTKRLKARQQNLGPYHAHAHGRGMIFSELRAYQSGDDIRHMEWRVTARTGKPHVKLYQEERECPVLIAVDFNPSMYFGTRVAFKSVIAARLAALVAWTASQQGDRVGGVLMSKEALEELPPSGRYHGVLLYLARLSEFTTLENHTSTLRPLSDLLLRLARVAKPGTTVIVMSDFYSLDEKSEEYLSGLGKKCNVIFYHVMDPLEMQPPKPNFYVLSNGQTEALLNTHSPEVVAQYQQYFDNKRNSLQSLCKTYHIQYVSVSSLEDLALIVMKTFPRKSNA
jgi:uncharacterized protein (DUF58 family)